MKKISDEEKFEIRHYYKTIKSIRKTAKKFGRSPTVVGPIVREDLPVSPSAAPIHPSQPLYNLHKPTNKKDINTELKEKIDKIQKTETNRRITDLEKIFNEHMYQHQTMETANGIQNERQQPSIVTAHLDPSSPEKTPADTQQILIEVPKGTSLTNATITLNHTASESTNEVKDSESVEDTDEQSDYSDFFSILNGLLQSIPQWQQNFRMIKEAKNGKFPSIQKKLMRIKKTEPLDIKPLNVDKPKKKEDVYRT